MLRRLELLGFKSFREAAFDLGPLTVLVGANAAGKSNTSSSCGEREVQGHCSSGQPSTADRIAC
jgi:hypothetical protein